MSFCLNFNDPNVGKMVKDFGEVKVFKYGIGIGAS
jgi:hypothetical protein